MSDDIEIWRDQGTSSGRDLSAGGETSYNTEDGRDSGHVSCCRGKWH